MTEKEGLEHELANAIDSAAERRRLESMFAKKSKQNSPVVFLAILFVIGMIVAVVKTHTG